MHEFDELYRLAADDGKLESTAPLEEQIAFYSMLGALTAYGKRTITKNEAGSVKAKIRSIFTQIRECRIEYVLERKKQQDGIKAANGKLTELMKSMSPDADREKLLIQAMDVICALMGMETASLAIQAEKKLKAEPEPKKAKRFTKPTAEQVREYCAEAGLDVDAEQFIDYYESKGWMIGKNSMKDWKAAARNWSRREHTESSGTARTASYDIDQFRRQALEPIEYKKKEKTA